MWWVSVSRSWAHAGRSTVRIDGFDSPARTRVKAGGCSGASHPALPRRDDIAHAARRSGNSDLICGAFPGEQCRRGRAAGAEGRHESP